MNFVGTSARGRQALVALGPEGPEICRASLGLSSFSPALDRDLVDLGLAAPAAEGEGFVLFGHRRSLAAEVHPEGAVVCLSGAIDTSTASHLGPGRVWFVGARGFSRAERDYARHHQRLLPWGEVDLEVATKTAAAEVGELPVFLSVDLSVLNPAFAPGVERHQPLGAGDTELWRALRAFQPRRLEGIEVFGLASERDQNGRTATLAAQLVRDLTLLHFKEEE